MFSRRLAPLARRNAPSRRSSSGAPTTVSSRRPAPPVREGTAATPGSRSSPSAGHLVEYEEPERSPSSSPPTPASELSDTIQEEPPCSSATSPNGPTRTRLRLLRRHRRDITDLGLSNGVYDPKIGAELYNRYLDEKVYAEEMGFDGLMLNEHHSTPFCMGGVDERRGGDPRAHHQAGQDRAARQRPADLGRPALAGRGARR